MNTLRFAIVRNFELMKIITINKLRNFRSVISMISNLWTFSNQDLS